MCSRKLKRCSSVSALEYHSMVLSQQLAPVHQEPITSHPLDIHTITGVQRMKFLFHPISPPSQCQAADLGCPVWSDGLGGALQNQIHACSPPPPSQSLHAHPAQQEVLLKSQFSDSTSGKPRSLPEASEHLGLIVICSV